MIFQLALFENLMDTEKVQKKRNYEPTDIIYEPVNYERYMFFFTDDLHLAYRSYYSKKKMEATRLPIPLESNVTIAIIILPGTKVDFMIM